MPAGRRVRARGSAIPEIAADAVALNRRYQRTDLRRRIEAGAELHGFRLIGDAADHAVEMFRGDV
jgi:hypothetical protein